MVFDGCSRFCVSEFIFVRYLLRARRITHSTARTSSQRKRVRGLVGNEPGVKSSFSFVLGPPRRWYLLAHGARSTRELFTSEICDIWCLGVLSILFYIDKMVFDGFSRFRVVYEPLRTRGRGLRTALGWGWFASGKSSFLRFLDSEKYTLELGSRI